MNLASIKKLLIGKSANQVVFFNVLGPVILNGINFFTVPVFTRLLGAANYGLVSVYTTWVQVFTIIMGLQTVGAISTARVNIPDEEHDKYYSSTLFLSCCSSAAVLVLTLLFIKPLSAFFELDKLFVLLMVFHGFGAYVISFVSMKYIHNKQASMNFVVSVATSLASLAFSLVFIALTKNSDDYYVGRILGYAIPNIIIGLVLATTIFRKSKCTFNKTYWAFCLSLCVPLIFHNLSQIIMGQAGRVMIQKLLSDDALVGVYSFVFNFVHIINVLYSALNNTWVPFYFDHLKAGEYDRIHTRTKNYIEVYTILSLGFMLLAPEVAKAFSSEEYWSGFSLIPVMVIAYYFVFLYSFPVNYEFFHKKTKTIAIGTVFSAVVNVVLNLFMIKLWGIMGAAIATAISYFALFVFHHISAKYVIKTDKYHYKVRMFILPTAAIFVGAAVFFGFFDYWLIRWSIGAVLGLYLLFRVYKRKSIF